MGVAGSCDKGLHWLHGEMQHMERGLQQVDRKVDELTSLVLGLCVRESGPRLIVKQPRGSEGMLPVAAGAGFGVSTRDGLPVQHTQPLPQQGLHQHQGCSMGWQNTCATSRMLQVRRSRVGVVEVEMHSSARLRTNGVACDRLSTLEELSKVVNDAITRDLFIAWSIPELAQVSLFGNRSLNIPLAVLPLRVRHVPWSNIGVGPKAFPIRNGTNSRQRRRYTIQ